VYPAADARHAERYERLLEAGLALSSELSLPAIGHIPVGRGILGVLIDDAVPLRLRDIAEDARSVGFPPTIRRCAASSAPRSPPAARCSATST
jgi:hypothetical protein